MEISATFAGAIADKYRGAVAVLQTLKGAGFKGFLVGGCVRDLLIGRPPKDFDIATDATPKPVAGLFRKCICGGEQFGVMRVLVRGGEFEVATFRRDGVYHDGRHPDGVEFSTPEEDAQRRDITINSLFLDLADINVGTTTIQGEVIDFTGGLSDLKNRRIRAVGNPFDRIIEDNLRLLRVVRFATQLGFEIEENTLRAVREHAAMIRNVSQERITDEFLKIITSPSPHQGFRLLAESGVLDFIPFLPALEGEQRERIEKCLGYHPPYDVPTGLALVLKFLIDTEQDTLLEEWRLPNKVVTEVRNILSRSFLLHGISEMDTPKLKRLARDPQFGQFVQFHCAVNQIPEGELEPIRELESQREEWLKTGSESLWPVPVINGTHLMKLGYFPGPRYKQILFFIEDLLLDGEANDFEVLKKRILSRFQPD